MNLNLNNHRIRLIPQFLVMQIAAQMSKYQEVREKIILKLRAGERPTVIAKQLRVSRMRVYRTQSLFEATGSVKARHGGGPARTWRTKTTVRAVCSQIRRNPRRSARQLSRDFNMTRTSMNKLLKQDLHMMNRAIVRRHFMSERQKATRTTRAQKLLNWLKSHGGLVHVFSDEKLFSIDAAVNRRNDRYLSVEDSNSVPTSVRLSQRRKNAASVMVLGVITSDGLKCPPIFVHAGVRINAATYQELLRAHVLPWLQQTYPEENYVFQQALQAFQHVFQQCRQRTLQKRHKPSFKGTLRGTGQRSSGPLHHQISIRLIISSGRVSSRRHVQHLIQAWPLYATPLPRHGPKSLNRKSP